MWIKLINAGLSSKIMTIIKAVYNKISVSVKLRHEISSCFNLCLRLKQGEPCYTRCSQQFLLSGLKDRLYKNCRVYHESIFGPGTESCKWAPSIT